ncbi:MAG TPA: carboxypeptidase regulatory-like domain-containing protein [Candidatus Limnocylindrales bacterium]|nr:carboxypeptidase regulatory-like domain-containing protein [Candidatus Limnocylindrales bacterium]
MKSHVARFFLLLLVVVAYAFAQTIVGRISGTVEDPSGAPVPSAKVTVTNTDTHLVRNLTTDDKGFYVADNLPIGTYSVLVNQSGFKKAEQTGMTLAADGHVTVDFHLQLGESTQTVEVVGAAAETLNTVSGEVSQVIDKEQVDNMPLNGRTYMELLTLVPGAVITNPDQFSTLTSLSATNQSVNGHRTNSNNMTVDGLVNLDGGANGSLINNVSPDFSQQVKIQTSNFSAEYGRSSGVAFNVVTKSGTNAIHGGVFEYFRNDVLDARNFFSPSKTQLRFNDFGYDIGGPIKKDKLFLFFGEEWKRLRQQASPIRLQLPTTAELAGNFVGSGKTINLPGTKTPVPGNIIPSNLITADGQAIANVYKYAISQTAAFTNLPTANNAVFQVPNPLNYREDVVRVDYRINDRHNLWAKYLDDENSIYLAYGPGSVSSSYIPVVPENRNRPAKSTQLSETWVISPSVVNLATVGASWNGQRYQNLGDQWKRETYGFTFQRVLQSSGPFADGVPDVNIQNFQQWKGPDQTLTSPITNIQFDDKLSWTHGQHTFSAGFSVIRYRKDQNGRSNYDASVVFNTSGNPNTSGYALADALMGNFQTYTEAAYDPMGHYRYTEPGGYFDDSWKVTRRLSLDLGLRYEYMNALYSTVDNLSNFVPSLFNRAQAVTVNSSGQVVPGSGNIYDGLVRVANGINPDQAYLVPNANNPAVLAVPAGAPRGMYPSRNAWEPRVGFAYQVAQNTVFRGGFGIFYDRIQGNPTMYTLNNPPYVGSVSYNYSNLSNITGGATVNAPWGTLQVIDPKLHVPYSEQFSFGIQRDLPMKLFAEADFVGSLGRHLLTEPDINQPYWDLLSAVPSTTNLNSIRPFPGYSTIQQFESAGTSNYYGLQTRLERRVGRVMFTAGYTFSKNLSDASSDTQNDNNFYNIRAAYGPAYSGNAGSSVDVRHAFVGTFIWYMPTLKSQKAYLRQPFGGWQLNGIIHLQSGFYYTVQASTAILGTRSADYVGGPAVLPNPGPNGWINPAAFYPAPQDRFGSSGFGNVEGPGLQVYNLSIAKFFNVTERVNLRFRAEFLNAFNNVNFGAPATSWGSATSPTAGFGTISSAYPPRNIQLSLKLAF